MCKFEHISLTRQLGMYPNVICREADSKSTFPPPGNNYVCSVYFSIKNLLISYQMYSHCSAMDPLLESLHYTWRNTCCSAHKIQASWCFAYEDASLSMSEQHITLLSALTRQQNLLRSYQAHVCGLKLAMYVCANVHMQICFLCVWSVGGCLEFERTQF